MKPNTNPGAGPIALACQSTPALSPRTLAFGLMSAVVLLFAAGQARAECRINIPGAKCVEARTTFATPEIEPRMKTAERSPAPFSAGDTLPEGYMILLNSEYYGFPPAGPGWMYFRAEDHVLRVDYATREVLEDVTYMANRAFF